MLPQLRRAQEYQKAQQHSAAALSCATRSRGSSRPRKWPSRSSLLQISPLCVDALRFTLVPLPSALKVREGLLEATFGSDAELAMRILVSKDGKLAEGLRAAPLCASGATTASAVLECAIASEVGLS